MTRKTARIASSENLRLIEQAHLSHETGTSLRKDCETMKTNSFISVLLLAFTLVGSLLSGSAFAWWNKDWAYRTPIKLDTTSSGVQTGQALEQVPLLVRLHTGNFSFVDGKTDGSDIRFVAGDDTTPLKYQIEKFDPVNNLAYIWVMLPKLDAHSKAQSLWMYYGNDAATAADTLGIYAVNQLAVLHFKDKDGFKDATAYATPVSAKGVTIKGGAIIASGAAFNGNASLVIAPTPANAFAPARGFSFSAWVNSAAAQQAVLFARQAGGVEIGLDTGAIYARVGTAEAKAQVALAPGGWHHLAVTVTDKVLIYLDGKQVAILPVAMPMLNGEMVIGAAADGSRAFKGEMDEVRIANTALSADWFVAEVGGEGADAKLLSYAPSEAIESGGSSHFATILHSVTLDGWVVIGILMVMAIISWIVMVGKGLVIRRVVKDNEEFLASYNKLAADPGALDRDEVEDKSTASEFDKALFGTHDHFQSSPIYRIYHAGVQEIKRRFGTTDPSKVHDATLSPQAIEAIRASLDATLTRENQKLNRQMVLLTIAISGGPFLGLLGTVIGVMITFAAIAAAGDVNVNAIAPGIAAALVATIAGLAVAIPALFGYNYLGSRIKDIHADMQVFSDEFISRIAERYQAAETTRGSLLRRGAA